MSVTLSNPKTLFCRPPHGPHAPLMGPKTIPSSNNAQMAPGTAAAAFLEQRMMSNASGAKVTEK